MATTNLQITKIKSKQKLSQKVFHILRKGDYKDIDINIYTANDLSYLDNTSNRSKISSKLATYKKRVQKYELELQELTDPKKITRKENSILKNKQIVKELEEQLKGTVNQVRPNFIEIVTLITQAQHLLKDEEYIQALYEATNRWLKSLDLGETIIQASHMDQSNPHIHTIIQLPTSFSKVVEDKELSNQPYKFLQKSFNEFIMNDKIINNFIKVDKQKKLPIDYIPINQLKEETKQLSLQLQPPSLNLTQKDIVYTKPLFGKKEKAIKISSFKRIKKSFDNFHNKIINQLTEHKVIQNINQSLKTKIKELEHQVYTQQIKILDLEFYKNNYNSLQSKFDNLQISFDNLKEKNKELVDQKYNINRIEELTGLEQDMNDIELHDV